MRTAVSSFQPHALPEAEHRPQGSVEKNSGNPGRRVRALSAGAVLAISAVLATGCGVLDEKSSVAETVKEVVQTPQEKLLAAAATPTTEPYTYTIVQKGDPADAQSANGSVDPAGKAYEVKTATTDEELDYTLKVDYRVVGPKAWVKVKFEDAEDLEVPEIPDKWLLIDPAKLKGQDYLKGFRDGYDEDPAQLSSLLTTAEVEEGAGGKFTGTFDLTQQPDVDIVVPATRKALGEKGKALPFTATVVDGKVTDFVLSIPATSASKAQTYTVHYEKFGATAPIAPPTAAESAPAPAAVYEMFSD